MLAWISAISLWGSLPKRLLESVLLEEMAEIQAVNAETKLDNTVFEIIIIRSMYAKELPQKYIPVCISLANKSLVSCSNTLFINLK